MHIDDLTGTPAPDFPLGMLAAMHNQVVLEVQNLEHQFKTLSLRLEKFSRAHVLAIVGGLQTLPEYHPATVRFESLAHLAALRCVRKRSPNAAQIREWLNDILLPSAVGDLEDPVEDVFTSNVVTWWGNIRIFEGTWETSDFGLQAILNALRSLGQDAQRCAGFCERGT